MERFFEAHVAIKRILLSKKTFVILCTFIQTLLILGLSDRYDNRSEYIIDLLIQRAN